MEKELAVIHTPNGMPNPTLAWWFQIDISYSSACEEAPDIDLGVMRLWSKDMEKGLKGCPARLRTRLYSNPGQCWLKPTFS